MKKFVSFLAVCAFLFVAGAPASAAPAKPIHLSFASQEIGSAWYVMAANIAQAVRSALPEKSTIDVLPYGGGNGSCIMVSEGKADMAIVFNIGANWAVNGAEVFKQPLKNLRGLTGSLDQYYEVVVIRAGLGITSLKEVKEKKLPIRLHTVRPNGTGETGAKLLLAAYGITYNDIKSWGGTVEQTTRTATSTAFQDGRADMYIHSVNRGHPAVAEIAISTPVKFLNIEPEIIEKLYKYGFTSATLPAGSFKGQDAPVQVPGLTSCIIVSDTMSEDTAYSLAKGICESKEDLIKGHAAFSDFKPEQAWKPEYLGAPLHPGAARYYKEKGWMK